MSDATLAEMADELRRRARLPCPVCQGVAGRVCPRCAGRGYTDWPELWELAEVLRNVAGRRAS